MADLLTEEERQVLHDLLGSPIKFPTRFKQWFIDYASQNIPPIPIDHIEGYVKTRGYGDDASPGTIALDSGWVAAGGPTFSDIPGGVYLMQWGFFAPDNASGGGITFRMGPVVDGGGNPSEDQACKVSAGSVGASGARARVIEVGATSTGQGSLDFKYRADTWSGAPTHSVINSSWATLVRVG